MKPGDLIAFSGDSFVSDVINIGTYGIPRWSASHVGIMSNANGRLLMFEATTLEGLPCEILHKKFDGCQAHVLEDVLATYKGKAWAYPLYRPLYASEEQRLTEFLMGMVGTPYSEVAAFRSAGLGFSWLESVLRPRDMRHIFCSELDAAAYSDIGLMPVSDPQRWSPNHLVRYLRSKNVLLRSVRLK